MGRRAERATPEALTKTSRCEVGGEAGIRAKSRRAREASDA